MICWVVTAAELVRQVYALHESYSALITFAQKNFLAFFIACFYSYHLSDGAIKCF